MMHPLLALCLLALARSACAWDDNDLEVFDAVEEVNQNFYELLGVTQEAAPQEIKSAFKKLTLKLHPDKNDSPDADVQFRNLVSVHNVLKDPAKREKYNEVLKNGLPNWRSAVYYYRHVRKMGLVEGAIILFIIITFSQYLVGWAAYVEKRYTAEQILNSRGKRQKRNAFEAGVAEILEQLPRPSVKDTLPFQIPKWIYWSVVAIPSTIIAIHTHFKEQKEEKIRQLQKEEEERERAAREAAEAEAARAARAAGGGARRRRGFVPAERDCLLDAGDEAPAQVARAPSPIHKPVISGGLWTDEDLAELVRLVKKYPPGASERWERIAEAMNRPVNEVTHMAHKLKDNLYRIPGQEEPEAPLPELPKKVKTRKNESVAEAQASWTQAQQQALESALARFPKSGAADRWEKIAKCVPDKTKEECMLRCKYLADLVRRQKQKEEETARLAEAESDAQPQLTDNDT